MLRNAPDHDRGNGEQGNQGEVSVCPGWPSRSEHTKPHVWKPDFTFACSRKWGMERQRWTERYEENFCSFSVVMVQQNRIHAGMCSMALLGVPWPSISCSQTRKSQLMSSFRVMQTIKTLANVVLCRKEQQQRSNTTPQNTWVCHTLNINANSTLRSFFSRLNYLK